MCDERRGAAEFIYFYRQRYISATGGCWDSKVVPTKIQPERIDNNRRG
jgi:hypothetical protein